MTDVPPTPPNDRPSERLRRMWIYLSDLASVANACRVNSEWVRLTKGVATPFLGSDIIFGALMKGMAPVIVAQAVDDAKTGFGLLNVDELTGRNMVRYYLQTLRKHEFCLPIGTLIEVHEKGRILERVRKIMNR
ncbi:MAG: hypothetical protein HY735_27560 [Verrucomicrobia bacterium]|nr:hypothetical protein [Verrucomicrobiota bacterium]